MLRILILCMLVLGAVPLGAQVMERAVASECAECGGEILELEAIPSELRVAHTLRSEPVVSHRLPHVSARDHVHDLLRPPNA